MESYKPSFHQLPCLKPNQISHSHQETTLLTQKQSSQLHALRLWIILQTSEPAAAPLDPATVPRPIPDYIKTLRNLRERRVWKLCLCILRFTLTKVENSHLLAKKALWRKQGGECSISLHPASGFLQFEVGINLSCRLFGAGFSGAGSWAPLPETFQEETK